MGVKLMTGATGEQNIEAADDRECLAGITGLDSYVFDTGSKLKATLVDANTVTIGTGAGSMQGSRFRCPTTTTVTIKSGTQGQYRHDIVGLHFSRTASGKESLEFQVLTGKPAASEGAATDQAFAAGDLLKGDAEAFMPLYRVKLSGINAADPEPMFSVLTPLATVGKSISNARNALILSEDVHTSGYKGSISVRHDGFGTVAKRYDEAGFVVDEETFVQVSGLLWTVNESSDAWPTLVKAPWQPDDLKDYWCVKIPIEVAKKGAGSVSHRTHFDKDCALYFNATANGSLVYSGVTTKRLFTSTDGYIYIAMHKTKPGAAPAIIYVDTTIPLTSL